MLVLVVLLGVLLDWPKNLFYLGLAAWVNAESGELMIWVIGGCVGIQSAARVNPLCPNKD
jgi:hypothetical protein